MQHSLAFDEIALAFTARGLPKQASEIEFRAKVDAWRASSLCDVQVELHYLRPFFFRTLLYSHTLFEFRRPSFNLCRCMPEVALLIPSRCVHSVFDLVTEYLTVSLIDLTVVGDIYRRWLVVFLCNYCTSTLSGGWPLSRWGSSEPMRMSLPRLRHRGKAVFFLLPCFDTPVLLFYPSFLYDWLFTYPWVELTFSSVLPSSVLSSSTSFPCWSSILDYRAYTLPSSPLPITCLSAV